MGKFAEGIINNENTNEYFLKNFSFYVYAFFCLGCICMHFFVLDVCLNATFTLCFTKTPQRPLNTMDLKLQIVVICLVEVGN